MNLIKSIQDTKKEIRRHKKNNPHFFPEYVELMHAEQAVVEAKKRLADARERWKKVGN